MKKLFILILIMTFTLIISGCGKPAEKDNIDLDAIKADENLRQQLYNEVCFNEYKVGTKWDKTHYEQSGVKCFYVNVNDYDEEDIKKLDLSIFENISVEGILKSKVTKVRDEKDNHKYKHGVPLYTANSDALQPINTLCRINDENQDYCLSTEWDVRGGVSERYVLIELKDQGVNE